VASILGKPAPPFLDKHCFQSGVFICAFAQVTMLLDTLTQTPLVGDAHEGLHSSGVALSWSPSVPDVAQTSLTVSLSLVVLLLLCREGFFFF
jgi:hypothetical protein